MGGTKVYLLKLLSYELGHHWVMAGNFTGLAVICFVDN